MFRLFVALRPSRATREQLSSIMHGIVGARWQDDDQLHLTLRFIGEVDRHMAEDVADALDRIDRPCPTITLAGVGAFGRKGRAHTLWAGVRADAGLDLLQRRIERALVLCGIAPEARAFTPHITLARLNRTSGPVEPFLAANGALAGRPEEQDAFYLFESSLGHEGATYTIAARYPLDRSPPT